MQAANRSSAAPIEGAGYPALLRRVARIEELLDEGDADTTEEHAPISTEEASRILQEHRP